MGFCCYSQNFILSQEANFDTLNLKTNFPSGYKNKLDLSNPSHANYCQPCSASHSLEGNNVFVVSRLASSARALSELGWPGRAQQEQAEAGCRRSCGWETPAVQRACARI